MRPTEPVYVNLYSTLEISVRTGARSARARSADKTRYLGIKRLKSLPVNALEGICHGLEVCYWRHHPDVYSQAGDVQHSFIS